MSQLIEKAKAFAYKYHEGQKRKGKDVPFTAHLEAAVKIVESLTDDEDIIVATWLHDVVEDTQATIEDIEAEFGSEVKKLVAYESEDKRHGQNEADTWKDRKLEQLETLRQIPEADQDVYMITLADKLANLEEIFEDIKQVENPKEFWARFNNSDPKDHLWYYSEMANIIKTHPDLASSEAYQRLEALIKLIW